MFSLTYFLHKVWYCPASITLSFLLLCGFLGCCVYGLQYPTVAKQNEYKANMLIVALSYTLCHDQKCENCEVFIQPLDFAISKEHDILFVGPAYAQLSGTYFTQVIMTNCDVKGTPYCCLDPQSKANAIVGYAESLLHISNGLNS